MIDGTGIVGVHWCGDWCVVFYLVGWWPVLDVHRHNIKLRDKYRRPKGISMKLPGVKA